MRRNNGIALALLMNALLIFRFSYRKANLQQQISSIRHGIRNLNDSTVKLMNYHHEVNQSSQILIRMLQSNYLRLKSMTEYTRRYHVRIKGIPEKKDQDLVQEIKAIGEHMNIPIFEDDIFRVNRVGTASKKGVPRVVIAELSDLKLKVKLLSKASTALLDTPYTIQDDVTNHVMPDVFSIMEERDFPEGCGYISSISEPHTVTRSKKMFGAWLQDSGSTTNATTDNYIWILPHFYENSVVEEYASIHDLKHRRINKKYQLPYDWAGTGHVVYKDCLYFVKFGTNSIVRYEFASGSVLIEKALPKALYGNDAPYQWSGSTDIDLSVDNFGLYAIYATYENTMDIVIGRIDPITLELIETWETNWRKQWSGNAFMMCGVLYILKKYDESSTTLSYSYDTKIKRYRRIQIPFNNKYEWNTMLEYNPRKKMLYAWDRGYLVTYSLTFEKKI